MKHQINSSRFHVAQIFAPPLVLQVRCAAFLFALLLSAAPLISQNQIKMRINGNDAYTFDSSRVSVMNAFDNVMIGLDAGLNVGIGATDSIQGSQSVGIGAFALRENTVGFANVGIGYNAMRANLSGYSNTAMGFHAMVATTTGSHNTAIGEGALGANIDGHANTALGDDALLRKTAGNYNTAIGQGALEHLINGQKNVALGYRAGSGEIGSHRLYIHNDSTPAGGSLIYGEFDNGIVRVNGELQIGTQYKFPTTDGTFEQVMMSNGIGDVTWQSLQDNDPFNELLDSVIFDYPYLKFYQSGLPFPTVQTDVYALIDDSDADPSNELQTLSVSGDSLFISNGNGVKVPGGSGTSIIDDDGDTKVEALDFLFGNDVISFTLDNNNFLRMYGNRMGFINTNDNVVISDLGGLSPGSHNTFIGSNTGNGTTVGDNNTFLGSGAGASIFTGSGNVYLGKDAGAGMNTDNNLIISNSNTSTPLIHGNFAGPSLDINGHFHVKHTGTEAARFESTDNTIIRVYKAGAEKGFVQALNDDFIFGKLTDPGGEVQLYNQGHYLRLEDDGDVGIGTTSPLNNRLYVEGDNSSHAFASVVTYSGSSDVQAVRGMSSPGDGYGIGGYFEGGYKGVEGKTTSGSTFSRYGVHGTATGGTTAYGIYGTASGGSTANWAGYFASGDVYVTNDLRVGISNTGHELSVGGSAFVSDALRIGSVNGAAGYQLSVDGKIMGEELKIQDSGSWPDYVFADDYDLMSLAEVEQSIKENKHLPGIPSAAEVAENGILVGDMQKRMMEKIEELTLHVIALQKRVVELEGSQN